MISSVSFMLYFILMIPFSLLVHRYFVIRAEKYFIKKVNTSAERWASQSKPILGGIGFFASFILSAIIMFFFENKSFVASASFTGIVIAVTISFLMGLADDRLNTPPGFKFGMQLIVAGVLIFSGVYIHIFQNNWLNYSLTVFWVVAIMNSLNMLDNMDAVTTTVSITILTGIIAVLYITRAKPGLLVLSFGTLASLISFLYYNWNPSKMYMGDNGSQFIGSFLAILGIEVLWNAPSVAGISWHYSFVVVFLAFLVPITDTSTVTINRLMRGQSPFVGGRDHTTHHLSYLGLSDRMVATFLLSINALAVFAATWFVLNPPKKSMLIYTIGTFGLLVLITLYSITKISKPLTSKP